MGLTINNCTAFDILENLGEEMDLMRRPQERRWKAYLTQRAYDKLKSAPEGCVYESDGHEYIKVWDNQVIPFIIHMRIAGIDNALPEAMPWGLGCRRELDD